MEAGGLVSIIIPVFNVRPYLTEALDSVLHQTYENLEIIVIDDGSTDRSGEVCDEYAEKDSRVIVIHQENNGLSCARNTGLERMTGDMVAFLDSDDAYHPDFIRHMVEAMLQKKADLVVCKATCYRTVGRMRQNHRKKAYPMISQGIYEREDALRALAGDLLNQAAWNKLYQRKLWEEIRFPIGLVYEDVDTLYRVINCCDRIYVLDEPLYLHRYRLGSISKTCSQEYLDDYQVACSHFEAFVSAHTPEIFTEDQLKRIRRLPLQKMISYFLCLTRENGEGHFRKELRERILKSGREMGIGDSGFYKRVCYWMICRCPWMLRILYPAYYSVRLRVNQLKEWRSAKSEAADG